MLVLYVFLFSVYLIGIFNNPQRYVDFLDSFEGLKFFTVYREFFDIINLDIAFLIFIIALMFTGHFLVGLALFALVMLNPIMYKINSQMPYTVRERKIDSLLGILILLMLLL
jgi:uncharacterized membrane protein